MNCEVVILCDVETVLLGKEGAAAVFGPQKGASPEEVKILDARLSKLKDVIFSQTGNDVSLIKHGGAAGGVAATLSALLNAKLVNGIDHFLSRAGFEKELSKADLVITGEGRIDSQTLHGKGPFGVARAAKERGIPVIGLAGSIPAAIPSELSAYFDVLLSINNEVIDVAEAMKHTRVNLVRTATTIGKLLAMELRG